MSATLQAALVAKLTESADAVANIALAPMATFGGGRRRSPTNVFAIRRSPDARAILRAAEGDDHAREME